MGSAQTSTLQHAVVRCPDSDSQLQNSTSSAVKSLMKSGNGGSDDATSAAAGTPPAAARSASASAEPAPREARATPPTARAATPATPAMSHDRFDDEDDGGSAFSGSTPPSNRLRCSSSAIDLAIVRRRQQPKPGTTLNLGQPPNDIRIIEV